MSARPKIVFLDATSLDDLDAFDRFDKVGDFTAHDHTSPEQVTDRAAGVQVIITNKVKITGEMIRELDDLRLICVAATGVNNVDTEAAGERGIPVRNVAGYSTDSVAQLTMTAYFTVAMDLLHLNEAVYNGDYSKAKAFTMWRHPYHELSARRFGIIGLGTIGTRVAKLADAYGAEVVYHSISGSDHDVPYARLELEELLTSCDAISIHCALSDETRDLIGADELESMQETAYLINMARGGIVNEKALAAAIDAGSIAGAAVDTFSTEPLPADHPYLGVKNRERLLLTPHVAWASIEARTRLIDGIIENIREGWGD